MSNRRAEKIEREAIAGMQEELAEFGSLARMQNAINWAARSASMSVKRGLNGYFIGHVINELHALDDGAPLVEPEVK